MEQVEDEKIRDKVDLLERDRTFIPSDDLNFLIIGKTGHGKSQTGNSILGRKVFKVSSMTKSVTKEVKVEWAEHNSYIVRVVDGPGLMDTDLPEMEGKQKAIENMANVLSMCNGGVHAFILVIRFGNRLTKEELTAFSDLEEIYGPKYLKEHGIIVITGGDDFQAAMENDAMEEEDNPNKSFQEWCKEQDEDLFKTCPRIILFDNRTKIKEEKERQRNENLTVEISKEKGLYTSEHFEMYAEIREEIIKQHNMPLLKENIQRYISLLVADLESISKKVSLSNLDRLEIRIHVFNKELKDLDQSEKSVKQLICDVRTIQNTIEKLKKSLKEENTVELESHVKDLQMLRKKLKRTKETPWELISIVIGTVLTFGTFSVDLIGAGAIVGFRLAARVAIHIIAKVLQGIGTFL